jgi:glucokinase
MPSHAIAVLDVGGTSIKTGVVRGIDVQHGRSLPTLATADAETIVARLAEAADVALGLADSGGTLGGALGLAVAFPGPFDLEAGAARIRGLHKFDAIHGLALAPELRARTMIGDRPIVFVRDNEAAGVGEAVAGAGRGHARVLTITLGTGVGACLTEHGVPIETVGPLIVERLARRDTPWGRADDVLSARGLADRLGVDVTALRDAVANPASAAAVSEHGHRLGTFLAPVVDEVGAHAVVIGGGLADAFDRFGAPLRSALGPTPCTPAELGARGPLLGAARLAFG